MAGLEHSGRKRWYRGSRAAGPGTNRHGADSWVAVQDPILVEAIRAVWDHRATADQSALVNGWIDRAITRGAHSIRNLPNKELMVSDVLTGESVRVDAEGRFVCPECGLAAKAPQGLGSHRYRRHGVAGTSRQTRADVWREGRRRILHGDDPHVVVRLEITDAGVRLIAFDQAWVNLVGARTAVAAAGGLWIQGGVIEVMGG